MFGQTGNTSFGAFNTATQSSPFGQSAFGKPISSTSFGTGTTPVFGSNNTSLFSAKPAVATTGGLFGNTTATPAFGQPATTQSSFGAFGAPATNTSLFGTQQNANTSLFGSNNTTSAFGQANKPTGFIGFGGTTGSNLFGQPQQTVQQSTPFGQPNTTANTSLFGTPSGFRTGTTTGTGITGTAVKFTPVQGTDSMVKNGVTQNIATRHHCIMCMKEYENKSLEELRFEDYHAGQKGPTQPGQTTNLFGAPAQASPFGNSAANTSTVTSGFGPINSGFGVNNQANTTGGLFSKPLPGFNAPTTTTSGFAFNPTTSTGLFGTNTQAKPFGVAAPTTLFPSTNTNQQIGSGFNVGTQNTGFSGFGTPQANQSIGLFNQKPSAFNIAPATSNTGFGFGQNTMSNTTSNLFAKPIGTTGFAPTPGTGFGATTTGFNTNTGFGPTTANNSLFNSPFKPAGQQSSFFSQTPATSTTLPTSTSLSLGTSGSLFGQSKPGGLFSTNTAGSAFNSSGAFGTLGTFGTNSMTGQGLNLLGNTMGTNQIQQNSNSVPVHQQILALVSTPFGDSPLLKNLLPASGKAEELIKPTNSASKIMNGSQYKISTTNNSPKVKARVVTPGQLTKKSLFEGLEEEDPTLLEAFQPRSNTKRLVLRPKRRIESTTPEENRNPSQSNENAEENIEPSTGSNEVVDKENFQQINRPVGGDRRSSSSSWLKSHIPRATKIPEEEFDGQKSPFNSSDIPDEILENTVADYMYMDKNKTTSPVSTRMSKSAEDYSLGGAYDSSNVFDESPLSLLQSECETNSAKIILRRSGYFTIPPLDQLDKYVRGDTCVVPNFTIGRNGYGNVHFPDSFDVFGLNLDEIVHFRHKEVIIYPDDEKKPPVGQGLNRRAQVTLDRVWPHDKNLHEPIRDPERLAAMDYEVKLRRVSAKHDTRFLEYRPETGSWVFKVDHFSKYGLSDSDDEDSELPPDKMTKKLKIKHNKTKGLVPTTHKANDLTRPSEGKEYMYNLKDQLMDVKEDDENFQTDCDSLNESQEFIQEKPSALSPTSIYARLAGTDSHKLQLMKASFFDNDVEDMNEVNGEFPSKNYDGFQTQDDKLNLSKSVLALRSNMSFHHDDSFGTPKESTDIVKEAKLTKKEAKLEKSNINKSFPAPIINPVTRVLKFRGEMIPLTNSICSKLNFRSTTDMSIQMGRKFKPCWGPGLTLISLSTQEQASIVPLHNTFSKIETYVSGRLLDDNTSSTIVQRVQILGGPRADRDYIRIFKESIEDHLRVQLNHCIIKEEEICHWICPGSGSLGLTALHDHCSLAQDISDGATSDTSSLYATEVWQLCVALWGNLPAIQPTTHKDSHELVVIRREAFGEWLKAVVEEKVQSEIAEITAEDELMLSMLSANKLEEACKLARKIGDYTLALIISQLEGASPVKELLKQTIALWQATDILENVSIYRLKMYMLAAGEQLIESNDAVVNVCEKLDWKRALGIHLWYLSTPTASITDVLELYEAAFSGDDKEIYAAAPLPNYREADFEPEISSGKQTFDLCFHLLKLYATGNHPLEALLNPMTHTADPLDYRLSWLLQQVIVGLGYSHLSEHVAGITHANFAAQLEAHDLWHWAIFVVLHLNDPRTRRTAVTDLLSRHVQIDDDSDYVKREVFLIEELGIPAKWIYEAKATKGCSSKRYGEAAWYLLQAEQWNRAHEIIIEHLAADSIINENYEYLRSLLSPIVPSECNSLVNGWSYQGQLLWDYMEITVEIESFLKNPDYSCIGYKLERLQPHLTSLCTKVNQFPCPTAKLRLCQAEIAKRTLHLAKSLLVLQPNEERPSAKTLVRLVSQLPLPEDYAQQELRPIVNICVDEIFGH